MFFHVFQYTQLTPLMAPAIGFYGDQRLPLMVVFKIFYDFGQLKKLLNKVVATIE